MSAIGRLFARKRPAIEQRAMSWPAATMAGLMARCPDTISASNLTAYVACVDLISKAVAGLPASIVRDDGQGGRMPAPNAPAARLLQRPSKHQPWPAFIATLVSSVVEHGNAVALIQADGQGQVIGLVNVPWSWIAPVIIQGAAGEARLAFDLRQITAQSTLLGIPRRMFAGVDAVHVMTNSIDGIVGRSVLERAPLPIYAAIELQEWSSRFYRQGTATSGMVTVPRDISVAGKQRMEEWFNDRYSGIANAGKPLFLDAGAEFTPMTPTSVEAQVLESRRFAVEEICRLMGVPVELLMTGTSAPASLTPYLAAFATMTVAPLVQLVEWAMDDILPAGEHLFLDTASSLVPQLTCCQPRIPFHLGGATDDAWAPARHCWRNDNPDAGRPLQVRLAPGGPRLPVREPPRTTRALNLPPQAHYTPDRPPVQVPPSDADLASSVSAPLLPSARGLVRGDWTAVAAAQAVLVQSRIATPNDARRAVGLPAHPEGDQLGTGAPPSYPADASGSPSLAPKPGPGGAMPNVGTNENEGSG